MKKYLLAAIALLGLVQGASAQFNLRIDAGELRSANGTTAEPAGGLLQLIASPSGTFSAPTTTSYVSGDNVIIASFAMNNNGGTAETVNALGTISFTGTNYTLTQGEKLELRFYPTITFSGMPSAPSSGQTYGQVRSDSVEFGPSGGDTSETPWVVGASGSTDDFDYVTASNYSGSTAYVNATAYANFTVVPEPSSFVLFGCGLLGLTGLRLRRSMVRV